MTVRHIPKGGESGNEPSVREQWVLGGDNVELVNIGQQESATFGDLYEAMDNITSQTVTVAAYGVYEDYGDDEHWYAHNIDFYDFSEIVDDYWSRWQDGEFDTEDEALTDLAHFVTEAVGEVHDVVGFSLADHFPSGNAEPT